MTEEKKLTKEQSERPKEGYSGGFGAKAIDGPAENKAVTSAENKAENRGGKK